MLTLTFQLALPSSLLTQESHVFTALQALFALSTEAAELLSVDLSNLLNVLFASPQSSSLRHRLIPEAAALLSRPTISPFLPSLLEDLKAHTKLETDVPCSGEPVYVMLKAVAESLIRGTIASSLVISALGLASTLMTPAASLKSLLDLELKKGFQSASAVLIDWLISDAALGKKNDVREPVLNLFRALAYDLKRSEFSLTLLS